MSSFHSLSISFSRFSSSFHFIVLFYLLSYFTQFQLPYFVCCIILAFFPYFSWKQESILFKAGCLTGRIYSVTRKKVSLFFATRPGGTQAALCRGNDFRLSLEYTSDCRTDGRQGNQIPRSETSALRFRSPMRKRVHALRSFPPKICLFVLPNYPSSSCILDQGSFLGERASRIDE